MNNLSSLFRLGNTSRSLPNMDATFMDLRNSPHHLINTPTSNKLQTGGPTTNTSAQLQSGFLVPGISLGIGSERLVTGAEDQGIGTVSLGAGVASIGTRTARLLTGAESQGTGNASLGTDTVSQGVGTASLVTSAANLEAGTASLDTSSTGIRPVEISL